MIINEGINELNVMLERVAPAKVGVSFNSDPAGASVYVNGLLLGTTPVAASFNYGTYTARFSKSGYEDYTVQFTCSEAASSINVGTVLTPIPPPATPHLTLTLINVSRFYAYTYYPQILAMIQNNSGSLVSNRMLRLFTSYRSPSSGNLVIQYTPLSTALRVYGVPQSTEWPQGFTLNPGQSLDFTFIGQNDMPRDIIPIQVWLEDEVTGDKSNVLNI